ncbi:hypothetical protein B0T20DRAFT_397564 [Sordaria brevicollis]|uniref:Uncharacterized protein n=1 Tax=Sordaria brevicollis TaxID=83679 RepID=A0AAE0NVP2_SORBR|nr:hypothetical protein B0T20DRAFT_397564 [Sordaria brevicollis]
MTDASDCQQPKMVGRTTTLSHRPRPGNSSETHTNKDGFHLPIRLTAEPDDTDKEIEELGQRLGRAGLNQSSSQAGAARAFSSSNYLLSGPPQSAQPKPSEEDDKSSVFDHSTQETFSSAKDAWKALNMNGMSPSAAASQTSPAAALTPAADLLALVPSSVDDNKKSRASHNTLSEELALRVDRLARKQKERKRKSKHQRKTYISVPWRCSINTAANDDTRGGSGSGGGGYGRPTILLGDNNRITKNTTSSISQRTERSAYSLARFASKAAAAAAARDRPRRHRRERQTNKNKNNNNDNDDTNSKKQVNLPADNFYGASGSASASATLMASLASPNPINSMMDINQESQSLAESYARSYFHNSHHSPDQSHQSHQPQQPQPQNHPFTLPIRTYTGTTHVDMDPTTLKEEVERIKKNRMGPNGPMDVTSDEAITRQILWQRFTSTSSTSGDQGDKKWPSSSSMSIKGNVGSDDEMALGVGGVDDADEGEEGMGMVLDEQVKEDVDMNEDMDEVPLMDEGGD